MSATRLPVRNAFGLAASVLETFFQRPYALIAGCVFPCIAIASISYADAWLAARSSSATFFPDWLHDAAYYILVAVAFVSVIRFVVLHEIPTFLPHAESWKAVFLSAVLLFIFWRTVDYATDHQFLFEMFYAINGRNAELDMDTELLVSRWLDVGRYGLQVLAVALVYPLFGPIAINSQLGVREVANWHRRSFLGVLIFTSVLCAALSMFKILYWGALTPLLPDDWWLKPASFYDFDSGLVVLQEFVVFPLNCIYLVIPSIAVGLLTKGFRKNVHPS